MQAEIAAVLAYTASAARRMGLGISELAALEHLQGARELTPGQLGELLSMTSGAVTALVDRLVGGGYVERVPNPRDRRSSLLRPTATSIGSLTRCNSGSTSGARFRRSRAGGSPTAIARTA